MALEQIKFLGASVSDFSVNLGWNGEQTSISINLVEDLKAGDDYDPPIIGSPVTLEFGSFHYRGLLQSSVRENSFGGNPVYRVTVTDAKDILDGVQVILNGYGGSTSIFKNLLNAYGYLETAYGFGGAQNNENGIYWFLLKEAIEWIINISSDSFFGGKPYLRGTHYTIDLSEVPTPPFYYRVGNGAGTSLLEIISQVCLDGGHDFYLDITDDNAIRVRTVSRVEQPQLNLVQNFIDSHQEAIVSKNLGRELRHEITSSFIMGGQKEEVHESLEVVPMWGFDDDGHIIIGSGSGDDHTFSALAHEVSDIIGTNRYQCTVEELTYALVDQNAWQTYMRVRKASLCTTIGIDVRITTEAISNILSRHQIVNNNREDLIKITGYLQQNIQPNVKRLYEFVRKLGEDFYGKKFIARIPFVLSKIDAESLRVVYSQEPCSSGWDSDSSVLGLDKDNAPIFQDQQSKLECFVRFDNLTNINVSTLGIGEDAIVQNDWLFIKGSVDPKVYFVNGIPCALITLSRGVFDRPITPHGDISKIAELLGWTPDQLTALYGKAKAGGGFHLAKHPNVNFPVAAAVPLRSNVERYGPWYYSGQPGKFVFEVDDTLVPWEFGRVDILNATANAKISSSITNQTEGETGDITLAGAPIKSIGDALVEGGPIVTNMSIRYGLDGVTTSYGLQTYTARFGFFTKGTIERLRSMGRTLNLQKNLLRQSLIKELQRQIQARDKKPFIDYGALAEIHPRTPHNMIQAFVNTDTSHPVPTISFATQDEARASCNAYDDDLFKNNSAYMDLGGLFRPFTSDPDHEGGFPTCEFDYVERTLSIGVINPFKTGSDIQVVSYGDSYEDWFTYEKELDPETNKIRGFGLHMPIMGVGWGYAIDGRQPSGLHVGDDYQKDTRYHKVGPLDFVWDDWRKCWTMHDLIPGSAIADISSGASGLMGIYNTNKRVYVLNKYGSTWQRNKFGFAGYTPFNPHGLIAVDFDC